MGKKVAMGAAAGVLLVAAVVGTVIAVVNSNNKGGSDDITTSTKSVEALCSNTEYQDSCKRTLDKVSSSGNATDVIHTAVKAVLDEVLPAFDKSGDLYKTITDPLNQQGMKSCQQFLEAAIDDLRAVIHEAANIGSKSFSLRSWMGAVIAHQSTCLDELQMSPDLKDKMEAALRNATELSSNAMTLLTVLAKVAKGLSGLNITDVEGRLLAEDGYPKWMSAADRKLMGSRNSAGVKPDVVVAQDGSGNFKTISDAIKAVPPKSNTRFVIYVKAGTYNEKVIIPSSAQNIFMYGDGPRMSMVTGNKHFPVPTSETATFTVLGKGFICKGMGFLNTAGPEGHQAVALRVQSDLSAFFNCRMNGHQDTLYTHSYNQFYSNCIISGTIDFIFGHAAVILQNCRIVVRKPMPNQFNTVTADGRENKDQPTGTIIHGGMITAEAALEPEKFNFKSYLGRPWKQQARTIVMETKIGDVIRPEGWMIWQGEKFHETCYYAEYANTGPGANTANRVPWAKRSISRSEAMQYTVGPFLKGADWVAASGARFINGLRN